MKNTKSKWMPFFSAAVVVATFTIQPIHAELLEKTKKIAGATVRYKSYSPTDTTQRSLTPRSWPSAEARKQ